MSQLLALDATQIVLIVLIGLLVIAYPLLMLRRNKKENQRMTEQTNSLKRGDKVLTSSGVYGKIVDIKLDGTAKQVTIETGSDKFKSYMTVDAYAIYQVIKDEPQVAKELPPQQEKVEEKEEKPQEAKPVQKKGKKEVKAEDKLEEKQLEKPQEVKAEEPKEKSKPKKQTKPQTETAKKTKTNKKA